MIIRSNRIVWEARIESRAMQINLNSTSKVEFLDLIYFSFNSLIKNITTEVDRTQWAKEWSIDFRIG